MPWHHDAWHTRWLTRSIGKRQWRHPPKPAATRVIITGIVYDSIPIVYYGYIERQDMIVYVCSIPHLYIYYCIIYMHILYLFTYRPYRLDKHREAKIEWSWLVAPSFTSHSQLGSCALRPGYLMLGKWWLMNGWLHYFPAKRYYRGFFMDPHVKYLWISILKWSNDLDDLIFGGTPMT